jgi:hypothetical protein
LPRSQDVRFEWTSALPQAGHTAWPLSKIANLNNYRSDFNFSDFERLVLEYADGMTRTPVDVSDARFHTPAGKIHCSGTRGTQFRDRISLPSLASMLGCAQQVAPAFVSLADILSQHAHFAWSAGTVLCCGLDEALGVALWAHDMTVRSKIRTSILYFMIRVSLSYLKLQCGPTPGPKAGRRHQGEAGCWF